MHYSSFRILPVLFLFGLPGCHQGDRNEYYSAKDFYSLKKIDVHAHQLTTRPGFIEQARADNFILISLNAEVPDYPPIDSQQYDILQLRRLYPKDIYYATTFETATMNQPNWSARQIA